MALSSLVGSCPVFARRARNIFQSNSSHGNAADERMTLFDAGVVTAQMAPVSVFVPGRFRRLIEEWVVVDGRNPRLTIRTTRPAES